jgi:hypothetical protein
MGRQNQTVELPAGFSKTAMATVELSARTVVIAPHEADECAHCRAIASRHYQRFVQELSFTVVDTAVTDAIDPSANTAAGSHLGFVHV